MSASALTVEQLTELKRVTERALQNVITSPKMNTELDQIPGAQWEVVMVDTRSWYSEDGSFGVEFELRDQYSRDAVTFRLPLKELTAEADGIQAAHSAV